MKYNQLIAGTFLSCLTVLLLGCPNPQREGAAPGIRVNDPSQPYAAIQYNSVAIIDKSLQDWSNPKNKFLFWDTDESKKNYSKLSVESTNSRRSDTGTLEAWAVLRNRTNHPLQVEGRITFFDRDKVPCEEPSAWQRVYLQPNSVGKYSESSMETHDVSYYYIEIREGR